MPKVLVLFHSRSGRTAALADAIAEGAASVKFTEVDVRRIVDLAPEAAVQGNSEWAASRDLLARKYRALESVQLLADYDALILGSPTRFGVMSAEVKSVLDQAGPLLERGALADKVGSAFTSALTPHGGHETTIQSMLIPMMHYGMLLVPPGYTQPAMSASRSADGAPATTSGGSPTDIGLAAASLLGARVAKVSGWVRHAKGHDAHHTHADH